MCKISSVLVKKGRHNDTINFFGLRCMGIWKFCHYHVKITSYIKIFMNLNSGPKNSPMCQIWAWLSNYLENNSSFFVFLAQKMTWQTGNKRLLWQHFTTMVINKIRKMSIKGVKLKSESLFSISAGVLELWKKNLRGADSVPPGPDRVKGPCHHFWKVWTGEQAKSNDVYISCSHCTVETFETMQKSTRYSVNMP